MSVPLRNDEPEELSTADLARPKRPMMADEAQPRASMQKGDMKDSSPRGAVTSEAAQPQVVNDTAMAQLFPNEELQGLRSRWDNIQIAFVDEPRRAVEEADRLVASTMKRLAEIFAEERAGLEKQWDRGNQISTEDLRLALTRYRSFFHRLLAI